MAGFNDHVFVCPGPPLDAPLYEGDHWVDSISKCHYISVGTDTVADWVRTDDGESIYEVVVGASSTVPLQTIPLDNICALAYTICMFNSTEDKWRSLKLFGSKKTSTTIEDNVSNILGENLDLDLNLNVVATDVVLEAVNSETFPITVRFRVETI
jgi:hypothetical protein